MRRPTARWLAPGTALLRAPRHMCRFGCEKFLVDSHSRAGQEGCFTMSARQGWLSGKPRSQACEMPTCGDRSAAQGRFIAEKARALYHKRLAGSHLFGLEDSRSAASVLSRPLPAPGLHRQCATRRQTAGVAYRPPSTTGLTHMPHVDHPPWTQASLATSGARRNPAGNLAATHPDQPT